MLTSRIISYNNIIFVNGKGIRKTVLQRLFESFKGFHDKLIEHNNSLELCDERGSYSKTEHDATFMDGKEDYYNKLEYLSLIII